MKKVFLKDAAVVFTLANGKKVALMSNLDVMVEDVVGKALRLATSEEEREAEHLMEEDCQFWQQVELQEM